MRRIFVLVFLLYGSLTCALAQQPHIDQYEDTLNSLAKKMQRGENDSVRLEASNLFQYFMEKILHDSASFGASFDSVKNISAKTSPDKTFRLYTWNYPNYEGSVYRYFGYVQSFNTKTKKITLTPLLDSSTVIEKPASKKLKPDRWYGAVYYNILENKKGGKKYYTLFGWHGKDQYSTQKIIDALSFENGMPVFGLPVFKTKNIYSYRVIFEFTSQAVMSVRYIQNRKMIVFDHLSSPSKKGEPDINRLKGPDGSYDAFKFVKGHWELVEEVDVNNDFAPVKGNIKILKDDELKKVK